MGDNVQNEKPLLKEIDMDGTIPKDHKNQCYLDIEPLINSIMMSQEESVSIEELPLFMRVKRISFELSNMCVYSYLHKRCPTAWEKEKIILPSSVVNGVIDELSKIDFSGIIAFHIDNEPLIDPRLFKFIDYAVTKCPNAKIHILTNGFYLNQTMIDELCEMKVWLLMVSAYSIDEYRRLCSLKAKMPYRVFYSVLDSRKFMYDRKPLNLNKRCFALVNDLSVTCTGDITPCSLDWKHMHSFGNLYNESLEEILNKEATIKVYLGLAKGKRELHLCQRCDWGR